MIFDTLFAVGGDPNDDRFWTDSAAVSGRMTSSGAMVSPESALSLDAYFACIRNISEDMAKLPFDLVRKLPNGHKEILPDHPIAVLMNVQPNAVMRPQTFRETLTAAALGWGNGYAEIQEDGRGNPVALWPIHPSRVSYELVGEVLTYTIYNDDGSRTPMPARKMFHLPGFGGDGIGGYSLAHVAANSIGLGLDLEKSAGSFLKNGSRLSGFLKPQASMNKEQQSMLRDSWRRVYGGSGNSGQVAVLPHNVEWQNISIPAADAQFIEQRQMTTESLSRWLRMPPHKISDLSHATFSNIEQQDMSYMRDTLLAWDARWVDEVKLKLIGLDGSDVAVFGRHNFDAFLRPDTESRYRAYHTAMQNGLMSKNEVRAREDLPPVPGGDVIYVPLNMVPMGADGLPVEMDDGEAQQAAPTGNRIDNRADILLPVIEATAERLVINQLNFMSRIKPGDAAKVKESEDRHLAAVAEAVEPLLAAAGVHKDFAELAAIRYNKAVKQPGITPQDRREALVNAVTGIIKEQSNAPQ